MFTLWRIHIIHVHTYIHTYKHKQRIPTIFTYYSNPPEVLVGLYDACDLIYSIWSHQGVSKVLRESTVHRIRASVVVQREILCHSHFNKFPFRFYFFVFLLRFIFSFVNYVLFKYRLTLPPRSSLYRERRRDYKSNYTGPPRIFGLGNETFIDDPWISRRNPFTSMRRITAQKRKIFDFVHYKYKPSRRPFIK